MTSDECVGVFSLVTRHLSLVTGCLGSLREPRRPPVLPTRKGHERFRTGAVVEVALVDEGYGYECRIVGEADTREGVGVVQPRGGEGAPVGEGTVMDGGKVLELPLGHRAVAVDAAGAPRDGP